MKQKEKVLSQEIVFRAHMFNVRKDTVQIHTGETREFSIATHPGGVVIVPQLADGSFLMVRQWRRAVERELLEFPAGTLEVGEDPLTCAKRELIEETSHSGAEWIDLGELLPAPGFCTEKQYCYLARNLTELPGMLDEDEIIEVVNVTKDQFLSLVKNGETQDSKSQALFLRLMVMGLV